MVRDLLAIFARWRASGGDVESRRCAGRCRASYGCSRKDRLQVGGRAPKIRRKATLQFPRFLGVATLQPPSYAISIARLRYPPPEIFFARKNFRAASCVTPVAENSWNWGSAFIYLQLNLDAVTTKCPKVGRRFGAQNATSREVASRRVCWALFVIRTQEDFGTVVAVAYPKRWACVT
jgi:hypothetical protein